MKTSLTMFTLAVACAFVGSAMAHTQAEYKTQKDRVVAAYKAGKEKCDDLAGNAKCVYERRQSRTHHSQGRRQSQQGQRGCEQTQGRRRG